LNKFSFFLVLILNKSDGTKKILRSNYSIWSRIWV